MLTAAECDELTRFSDAAMERHQPKAGTGLEVHQTQVQLRLRMSEHPEFIDLVGQPEMVSLVAQLLSPNIHLHTAAVLFKHPYIGNDATPEEVEAGGGVKAVFDAQSAGCTCLQKRPRSRSCLAGVSGSPRRPDLQLLVAGHRDIGITEDTGHDGVFRGGVKVCYALTEGMDAPMGGMTMFAR